MGKTCKTLDPQFLVPLSGRSRSGKAHWRVQGASGSLEYQFIAFQPGSYVRPHCHPAAPEIGHTGAQFLVVLKGKLAVILIDEASGQMKRKVLSAHTGDSAIDIPGGVFHSAVALSSDTLVMEVVEAGAKKLNLPGSPLPDSPEAKKLVRLWTNRSKD